MLCGNCGHDNPNDNRFCGMCGMRMERIPAPQRESRSEYRDLVRERITTPVSNTAEAMDSEHQQPEAKEIISFGPRNGREGRDAEVAPLHGNSTEPVPERPRTQRAVSGPSFLNLEVPTEPPRKEAAQTISGPSFLGLADEARPADDSRYNIDYLLEDETKESHWRMWLVLIILVLFGVLAWLQLRHSGIDVASLMQRLRQAKLSTVQEQLHPTTGSADAAPAQTDAAKPATQTPPATAPGAAAAANQNQPATNSAQPAADNSKADTTKAQEANAPQESDLSAQGSGGSAASPEGNQTASKPAPSSDQPASDSAAAPAASDKSGAADTTPSATTKNQVTTAKSTPPKKPSASVADSEGRATRAQNAQGAALIATGEKYLYGRGVPQNCDRAISYLRKASEMGNAKGSSHLGAMYATGQCLPMDRVRAYKYFAQALHQDNTNPYFQHNLEMLWNEMSPDEKQQATARTPAQ